MMKSMPRTYSGRNLAIQVLFMLALFVWQGQKVLSRKPLNLRQSPVDMFGDRGSWPFRVVSSIFHTQFIVCATVCLFMLPVLRYAREPCRSEVFFLSQMQCVAALIGGVGLLASIEYHRMGQSDEGRVGESSWFAEPEPRLVDRYIMWAFLAPLEWLPYIWLYTKAGASEIWPIMVQTAIMCLLGCAAIMHDEHAFEDEGWQMQRVTSAFLFLVSCLVFVSLLKRVAALPPEPVTKSIQPQCLRFLILMWSAYPVLHILRALGFISAWTDQVLLTSFFDAIAKCVLHMFCWTGPLCQLWVSALGNLQIANSAGDCNLTVDSDSWTLAPGSGSSASVQEHLLGGDSAGSSLLEHVVHEDQRRAMLRAASHVDKEANFIAQKLRVDLRLSGGRAGKAELLIARNLYGRRQISLTLLEEACASTTAPLEAWSHRTMEATGHEHSRSFTESTSSIGSVISLHRLNPKNSYGLFEITEEQV